VQAAPEEDPEGSDDADQDEAVFWMHYDSCLPCSYPERTGDLRSVTTLSDFYSSRELHSTGMYADYFRPLGIEHEAMVSLPAPAGTSRRLIFFRGPGRDFDDRERLLLALLRPHLAELYRDLEERRSPAAQLTDRQRELLRLIARGHSNTEIARLLFLSTGTVRKHLENIFERLDVSSRTAAVAAAFPALSQATAGAASAPG
jgi:DNA-binding CsgD family transcriptional regulator